jgi:hypothetical protein
MSMSEPSSFRTHLLAFFGCLLLAVLITWPLVMDPNSGLIGHPGNDTWNHAWGMWWIGDGLANRGGLPTHTGLLNYPDGGSLFFIDTFNALWTAPFQRLFGLPFAYNLAVLMGVAWTAFGAWTLGYYVSRDKAAATVTAVAFGCNAHLLGQTYNGITETVNAGWIPLFLLALLKLLDRPSWKRGAWMGIFFGLCALSNFYYGLFCMLLGVVVLIHRGMRDGRQVRWKGFFAASMLGGVIAVILVLPVLLLLSSTMSQSNAMVSRDPQFVWDSLMNHNYTDVVGFFRPGKVYSPDLKAEYGEELIIVTYLGWVVMGLVGLCLGLHRRRRELSLWLIMTVVFLVFALGPYLHLGSSEAVQIGGRPIPLPFLAFFEAFPLFSRISHPFRFVVPALLAMSILAGMGSRLLLRGFSTRRRWWGTGAICAAICGEILLASPAVWPIPRSSAAIPDVYSQLEEGAVLDLPISVPNLERGVYTYYQTAHGLPSPYGLNEPVPGRLRQNRLTDFLLYLEVGRALSLPRQLPDLELALGAQLLRAQGYRYIVMHKKLYTQPKAQMIQSVLEGLFGPPTETLKDGVALFEIGNDEPASL